MEGLDFLKVQSEPLKRRIIEKYGSLEKYYEFVLLIYEAEYKWFSVKSLEGEENRKKINDKLNELEDELNHFGADDGHWILTEISSDQSDGIIRKKIQNLDEYLNQFGTNFEEMRKHIKEKYDT